MSLIPPTKLERQVAVQLPDITKEDLEENERYEFSTKINNRYFYIVGEVIGRYPVQIIASSVKYSIGTSRTLVDLKLDEKEIQKELVDYTSNSNYNVKMKSEAGAILLNLNLKWKEDGSVTPVTHIARSLPDFGELTF